MADNKRALPALALGAVSSLFLVQNAQAGAELSAGVWWVYQYVDKSDFGGPNSAFDADLDRETGGNFADPAFILYADDDGGYGPWRFSAEARIGRGSFTDVNNNSSGDTFAMHKAWIGYEFNDHTLLKVGKSQVPFGWKTVNFWPGDGLQGGYGDQMDVGFKLSGDAGDFHYDVAYYHQDDWGEDSTDTLDDNGHWGTSDSYRKLKTGVLNLDWRFQEGHTVGASVQYGRMQDLTADTASGRKADGEHVAYDLHYLYQRGPWSFKYRFVDARRDFGGLDAFLASDAAPADEEVKTQRHVAEVMYQNRNWAYYLDGGVASTDTRNNDAGDVQFYAPGIRYKYGPGWLYLEYLWSDGDIDANGDVYEGNFNAVYVAFDFYF
ncbi:hypothetical protein A3Q32_13740 [Alcanivorax sp. KX64203]|nr:hypothetical protein A3Q32_13740 [Alcanivorax sp. KX64203]